MGILRSFQKYTKEDYFFKLQVLYEAKVPRFMMHLNSPWTAK